MSLSTNTPIRDKCVTSVQGVVNKLDKNRNAVMKDTNFSVPLVPLSYFFDRLLPPLHDGFDVAAIVEKLQDVGHIDPVKGHWKVFPEQPSSSKLPEDMVFKPFAKLASLVFTQAKAVFRKSRGSKTPLPTQTVEFFCNPLMMPKSTNRPSTSKPDSYGVLTDRTVPGFTGSRKTAPHWDDIVIPGEKKKNNLNADFNDVRLNDFSPCIAMSLLTAQP